MTSWRICTNKEYESLKKLKTVLELYNMGSYPVRVLCIATGQYSSFCGCAMGLMLGGLDHTEVEIQDREQIEVREKIEAREPAEEEKTKKQQKMFMHM